MSARHLLTALLVLACRPGALDQPISPYEMSPRLEYQGFSFERPAEWEWYMLRDEQSPARALIRHDALSPTHSFYVEIHSALLPSAPDSVEALDASLDWDRVEDHQRFELLESERSPGGPLGSLCMTYSVKTLDRAAPNSTGVPLVLRVRGFACLHPELPRIVVEAFHSERGRSEELDPILVEKGERILRGVRFNSPPPGNAPPES